MRENQWHLQSVRTGVVRWQWKRKFDYALEACVGVVKNLRPDDLFSLVTFDSEVEVVLPLGKIEDKQRVCEIIKSLSKE